MASLQPNTFSLEISIYGSLQARSAGRGHGRCCRSSPGWTKSVNGGAIAIGHPLGCSGARLATTLIHQMARTGASRGIASLCVGVGQGLATIFERE
jgi:acetyl-CoA acetyltransferase